MKDFIKSLRWMAGQARPFLLSIVLIIISCTVSSLCGVNVAVASKRLIDAASANQGSQAVKAVILFAVLIFIQLGVQAADSIISTRTVEAMSNSIRKVLFSHLANTEWMDLIKYHSGDILTRMTSDVGTVTNGIINTLPGIISLCVRLTAAFIILLFYDPTLAVLAFILGPASVLISRFLGRKLKYLHLKIQETESTYRGYMQESIQNMFIVKAFCIEKDRADCIGKLQDERLNWIFRRSKVSTLASSILALGYWIGYLLAFGWGALRLSQGTATFGTIVAFLQLVEQIQGPFVGLSRSLPQIISASASAGRLMEFEALQLEKKGCPVPKWKTAGICFENVSFAYDKDLPVLKNMSIKILPGETAALIGSSGEGKTTFVRLLLGLLRPLNGHIYFTNGDEDRLEGCASMRKLISYVPQGNTLFSGTIEGNLRTGCPDASYDELKEAVYAACAWEFIEKLADGFNTIIGEHGLGLSEGQAQRIAIARALLKKAPILILDEATSALDIDTEIKVLHAVKNLSPKRTCIIITHRPSAVKICDCVLRLEEGYLTMNGEGTTEDPASEAV